MAARGTASRSACTFSEKAWAEAPITKTSRMITHVVLFRFRPDLATEERAALLDAFERAVGRFQRSAAPAPALESVLAPGMNGMARTHSTISSRSISMT